MLASIIERAMELARDGGCRSIQDIKRRLRSERYEEVDAHLDGAMTRAQLKAALGKRAA